MAACPVGFIGLGVMGGPMAANLAASGQALVCFDLAGTAQRTPQGAAAAASSAEVAGAAKIVFLSLPDGPAVKTVAAELIGAPGRIVEVVVDTTTAGIGDAQAAHARFAEAGIAYADAPVSGGRSGAVAGTLAMMVATDNALFERLLPLLTPMAKNAVHVGTRPGQGMTMKLLNNFLSGTAMVATSEAVAFGERQGLDPKTIIDVVNVSSGRNTATSDKFPNRIIPGSYDSGFATRLMAKDMRLYLESVEQAGTTHRLGSAIEGVWSEMVRELPESDFTEIYRFTRRDER
jgi:3-hydroxyisobutyrate dehydrogenase-like beta-hydroxyacid dehydrogenase